MSIVPSRGRSVLAALMLTLLLAALLGANVMVTSRYHRSVAEGVLRDYADFAAAELANRVQNTLAQRLFPVLSAVAERGSAGSTPLPLSAAVAARADTAIWRTIGPGLGWFRQARGGALELAGAPVPEWVRTLLADTVAGHARAVLNRQTYLALLWVPGDLEGRLAAMVSLPDSGVAGLLVPGTAFPDLLASVVQRTPLLPPSLTGGTRLDSVVTYEVRAPDGRVLLASPRMVHSPFRATRLPGANWGGMRLEVALDGNLAGRLVIGGLPRSRLPIVLALLSLTVLLVGVALFQLRRERDFLRQREEFVAGVSHELRTPLAQIRLFTETLRLGRVRSETERDHSLTIIDRESRRLTWMVENLLAVSRVARGVLTVAPRELDLARALRETIEGFQPLAAARGGSVVLGAPDRLIASTDDEAFRQIVLNLLDNAVKYGPHGQRVAVTLAPRDGMARLTVEDEGPGVPEAERTRVFERFVRLRNEAHSGVEGTGLGLALVRELALLHGGLVWVEGATGRGARFVVELPLAEAH